MAPALPVLDFLLAPRSADAISDIHIPSLELDKRGTNPLSPLSQHDLDKRTELVPRTATTSTHGVGTVSPGSLNNNGFFALFAILGVAMVLAALWFFFWAKNGGFQWRQGDWDDYKSTVLRRKGPDGKTLSNATKSTKLGDGTIVGTQRYAWAKNAARSVVGRDEKGRKGVLGKRGWAKTHSITYSDDFTDTRGTRTVYSDEMTEVRTEPDLESGYGHGRRYRDRDVRRYKKEKPARVGGLNREADGSHFDYTNTDRSDVMTETVISDRSEQPMLPKKDERREKDKQRAERKAREEAKRMERRWKREAEEAAAALARESSAIPAPPPSHSPRKSSSPHKTPSSVPKTRRDRAPSRSTSPKKRDFSYTDGPESEVLSTAYTRTTSSGQRTSSYYDEYRPRASENPRYSREHTRTERSSRPSSSSPRKKQGAARSGGYRRGGTDSDLE